MATNHTANYGLNLWEPGDAFLREEFNENTEKLEEAIDACRSVAGTYTSSGTEDVEVSLGFRPKLVLLAGNGFGFAMEGHCPVAFNDGNWAKTSGSSIVFTDGGFRVPKGDYFFNYTAGNTITYVAFH